MELIINIDGGSRGNPGPGASGCSYTTETRKCCNRTWCDWGVTTCASCTATSETRNCSGNVANATSGTQTRPRLVNSVCGSCSYGSWSSWSGTCTCQSGYKWDSSSQTCKKGCSNTCGTNQLLDEGSCYCCKASDYLVSGGAATTCAHSFNSCCIFGANREYYLSASLKICTQMKNKLGISGTVPNLSMCAYN